MQAVITGKKVKYSEWEKKGEKNWLAIPFSVESMAISLMVFHQCRIPRSVEGRFLSNCDSIADSTFFISIPEINTFLTRYENRILNKIHIKTSFWLKILQNVSNINIKHILCQWNWNETLDEPFNRLIRKSLQTTECLYWTIL